MSAKYASLHNHISSNKNANRELFLLKRFLFPPKVQKGAKELVLVIAISLLHGGDAHVENPYFHND